MAINSDQRVLRRVPTYNPMFWKPDGSVSSKAFELRKINGQLEKGVSVDIEGLRPVAESVLDPNRFKLFALRLSLIRTLDLDCIEDALPDNPAHALIIGEGLIGGSIAFVDKRRKLAEEASRNPVYLPA